MKEQHLRAGRLPCRGRAIGASRFVVDLPDAREFGLRKISLRPGSLVGRKSIGQRARVRLPNAALDPGCPRESGLHRLNQPLL